MNKIEKFGENPNHRCHNIDESTAKEVEIVDTHVINDQAHNKKSKWIDMNIIKYPVGSLERKILSK